MALNLAQKALSRMIEEKRIDWLSLHHAKVLHCLFTHKKVFLGDLMGLTLLEKQRMERVLEELKQKKLIVSNGGKYSIADETSAMLSLLKEAEKNQPKS